MGKGRIVKLVVCLMLVMSTLTLSFSVLAVDPSPSPSPSLPPMDEGLPVVWEEFGRYSVWLLLKSWGINITYGETVEFTDELGDYLDSLVLDFLDATPSIGSLYSWTAPWLWQDDFWGNLRYNNSMLEDVQDFADYLISLFELGDNENIQLGGNENISGITIYQCDRWYRSSQYTDNSHTQFVKVGLQENDSALSYWRDETEIRYFYIYMDNKYYYTLISPVAYTNVQFRMLWKDTEASESDNLGGPYTSVNNLRSSGLYWSGNVQTGSAAIVIPEGCIPLYANNMQQITSFIDTGEIVTEDEYGIVTEIINLPDNDPTYTEGDSVIIEDGNPIYITVEWPDRISIDNLPAVISPTTITDPDLEGVYGEVTPFIRTFSGGMDMMRSIIMQLPEEVIACLFALMGAIIIFGFIKIMREH